MPIASLPSSRVTDVRDGGGECAKHKALGPDDPAVAPAAGGSGDRVEHQRSHMQGGDL